jgi:hypothetical protein
MLGGSFFALDFSWEILEMGRGIQLKSKVIKESGLDYEVNAFTLLAPMLSSPLSSIPPLYTRTQQKCGIVISASILTLVIHSFVSHFISLYLTISQSNNISIQIPVVHIHIFTYSYFHIFIFRKPIVTCPLSLILYYYLNLYLFPFPHFFRNLYLLLPAPKS